MRKYINSNGDPITYNGRQIMVGDTIRAWVENCSMVYVMKTQFDLDTYKKNCHLFDKVELLNR